MYSTYLGGSSADYGYGIALDSNGSAYVTGRTFSPDFPVYSAIGAIFQSSPAGNTDVFVTKFVAAGNALVYSTYIGGSLHEAGYGIAVDSIGSAYITGWTQSTNFPTKLPEQTDQGADDAFVAKLSGSGDMLLYSTYLGGSGNDYATAIAVDVGGSAYVTGYTDSTNYPTVAALQGDTASTDAFVTKLNWGTPLPVAMRFIAMSAPCRVADTRLAVGPFGGPAIPGGSTRDFLIPSSACVCRPARWLTR